MKNNYLDKITRVLILMCLFAPLLLSQTETIPWIPLSKDSPANISGRNAAAPTFNEIGIPLYPGAYLTSYYPATSSNESGKSVTSLATVFLVTSDEIEKVELFYIKNLKKSDGWNFYEEYNVFVKGDLNDALSRTVPGVAIREETGESFDLSDADPDFKSTLKTRIKILYKP
jgi:hypothetical protein